MFASERQVSCRDSSFCTSEDFRFALVQKAWSKELPKIAGDHPVLVHSRVGSGHHAAWTLGGLGFRLQSPMVNLFLVFWGAKQQHSACIGLIRLDMHDAARQAAASCV